MSKKIIFMGTPIFAVPVLKSLCQNGFTIPVVYTQPPQKSHRGQKINKSPIQFISETLNIYFRCPENLNKNNEEYEFLLSCGRKRGPRRISIKKNADFCIRVQAHVVIFLFNNFTKQFLVDRLI